MWIAISIIGAAAMLGISAFLIAREEMRTRVVGYSNLLNGALQQMGAAGKALTDARQEFEKGSGALADVQRRLSNLEGKKFG